MSDTIIFLDIDGTLTPPGSNIPPDSALAAIRAAQKKGHRVALCSGRNYGMLSPLLVYGFDGVIASAGGYILAGDRLVYDCPMTPSQQQKALEAFRTSGVYRTVESRDGSYTDEGFKDFLRNSDKKSGNSEMARWREQLEQSLNIRPMAEYGGEPLYKIVFMSPSMERLAAPRAALEDEFDFCIQEADAAGVINGELINKRFNKGTAVRRLCEFWGVPPENTIAFGDSMNDWEMLKTAGLSICMENGSEKLRQIADEVCPAVEEDGLYKAFEKHGLL